MVEGSRGTCQLTYMSIDVLVCRCTSRLHQIIDSASILYDMVPLSRILKQLLHVLWQRLQRRNLPLALGTTKGVGFSR